MLFYIWGSWQIDAINLKVLEARKWSFDEIDLLGKYGPMVLRYGQFNGNSL